MHEELLFLKVHGQTAKGQTTVQESGRTKRKEPELEDGRIPTCPEEKCAETVKTGFPGKETSTVATYAKYSLSASEGSKTQEQTSPV